MLRISDFKGRRVHMVGIGGSSMSGLAEMLLKKGYIVTGSDKSPSHAVERLEKMGITVMIGHNAANIHGADLLIYSAAIAEDNPERMEAKQLGIPEMERSTLLGELMLGHDQVVCISGAHGKTSTSGMIAQSLMECGLDPTVHIGGRLDAIGGSSRIGKENVFVAEACEFHGSFLEMHPTVAIVLNIDNDHLDYYGTIDNIEAAFGNFLSLVPPEGYALGYGEDFRVKRLLSKQSCHTRTFGMTAECDYYPVHLTYNDIGCPIFDVYYHDHFLGHIEMKVSGAFHVLNALASVAAAHVLGAPMDVITDSLSHFKGVHRRFELTGIIDQVELYHDYGHNPAEMRAAVSVAKAHHPHRVWAVMQPHTYSRVKLLFNDYLTCTQEADITLVTDIYGAREVDPGDIKTEMLIEGMTKNGVKAIHTPSFDDTEAYLRAHWEPGDLVLTMGCGNINLLNEQINNHGDTVK